MNTTPKIVPMLFMTEMVQAIDIYETKTETRRTDGLKEINSNPNNWVYNGKIDNLLNFYHGFSKRHVYIKPKANVGDIIWVRETFQEVLFKNAPTVYLYKADLNHQSMKWKPSLYMPKEACRIFLKVVSVYLERLHDISEESAINEGVLFDVTIPVADFKTKNLYRDYRNETSGCADARSSYMTLWQKINGKDSWNKNPFVWVYKFEKTEKPINFLNK